MFLYVLLITNVVPENSMPLFEHVLHFLWFDLVYMQAYIMWPKHVIPTFADLVFFKGEGLKIYFKHLFVPYKTALKQSIFLMCFKLNQCYKAKIFMRLSLDHFIF